MFTRAGINGRKKTCTDLPRLRHFQDNLSIDAPANQTGRSLV
jgi:hypothetical protein